MTENKINAICQECGKQFEYNLKPGFPRKYCFECSEIKKALFADKSNVTMGNTSPDTPLHVPVERPGETNAIGMGHTVIVNPKPIGETYRQPAQSLPVSQNNGLQQGISTAQPAIKAPTGEYQSLVYNKT